MGTLHQGNPQSSTGMPNLNAVVQTSMMLHTLVAQNNLNNNNKIILGDRKLKLREIADTLKILESNVFTILHESLGMHKTLETK